MPRSFSRPSYLKIVAYALTVPLILYLATMCSVLLAGWLMWGITTVMGEDGAWGAADVAKASVALVGVCGWGSLLLLLCNFHKPWKDISVVIKIGCGLGLLVGGFSSNVFGPFGLLFFLFPVALLLLLMFQTIVINNLPPSIKTSSVPSSAYGFLLTAYILCWCLVGAWHFSLIGALNHKGPLL